MGTPGQAGRGGAAPIRRLVGPGKQPVCVRLPTGKLLWVVVPRGCLVQDLEDEGVHAPSARPPPAAAAAAARGPPPPRGAGVSSRAFPSWNRSKLAEIYLCHACSD
jgi:hypothetical protein